MSRNPLYLSRDRHGVFHFRARVPAHLRQHFNNKAEIKRTLKTDSRREAVRLARAYRVELDKKMAELEDREGVLKLITVVNLTLPSGAKAEEVKIDYNGDTEKEMQALRALVGTTEATVSASKPSGPLLSDSIERFIREKTELGHWKDRCAIQNQTTLRDFLEIVGDRPIDEITRQTITDFAKKFGKLPPNRSKMPEFKGKSIAEILKMEGYEPISPSTLRNNLNRVSSLFKWAKQHHLIDRNPAEYPTCILPKKARQKSKIDAREPFTVEELQRLFHSAEFKKPKKPSNYWAPVIALYSGARLEEICSRELSDIKRDGRIWYFDITDAKTEAGKRQTPIHHKVIDLGLLDYVERLKAEGRTRLFPELKPNKYGEFNPAVSRWFARYRDRCGIGESDGRKVFHSFRHNVVDCLKQKFEKTEAIHAIVGHEDKLAHGTYGQRYQAASLKPIIDQITFDVNLPMLDWKTRR